MMLLVPMPTRPHNPKPAAPRDMMSLKLLGEAIGVSEATIRRWADKGLLGITRTQGGHRRVSRVEAIRFIRESGCELIQPELLGIHTLEDARHFKTEAGNTVELLVETLKAGNAAVARGLIVRAYLSGRSIAWIADEMIRAALGQLGMIWKHENDGIFIEHRATDICVQAVNEVRCLLDEPPCDAPVAIGAAPPDDPYVVPTTLAAMALHEVGYRAVNLGPLTPFEAVRHGIDHYTPRLVWIAMSVTGQSGKFANRIGELADHAGKHNAHLILGGRGAVAGTLSKLPNATIVQSMGELVGFAKGLTAMP